MTQFEVKVFIRLRPSVLDPAGEAIKSAANKLGVDGIKSLRIGKLIEIKLDVEERIIWNNLNGQISNVLEKTNSEFKKNNIKEISLNSLINTLHLFWRRGRIDFSYK